ncbi:hypothetical protein [Deefgea sp. CFH1-16]|uniref:hypothetical protein n=1 Tax=Deefgea sp. CFH1-16 TaxID=2675457 RepID=UPI0019402E00|nr:hypothetical protein [Deefgea sp. CFH1-16]
MTTADSQPASPISAPALLRELQKNSPVFRDCLPLAIGVDKQLFCRSARVESSCVAPSFGNAYSLIALP